MLSCTLACAILLGACYSSSGGRDVPPPDLSDPAADDALPDGVPDVQPEPDVREDPDGGEPDLPPDIVPPVTAEEYCMILVSGTCEFLLGCCTPEELDEIGGTELGCDDPRRSPGFEECMEDPGEAITVGLISVDREAMEEMRQAMVAEAAACPGLGATSLSKAYVFRALSGRALRGRLEAGQPCGDEEECLEELTCEPYTFVCHERVREGGVCRDDTECDLDLVCLRARCNAPADTGEPCAEDEDCLVGLWCDNPMCAPLLAAGNACDPGSLSCEGLCSFDDPTVCRDFCDGI
jgi:hypothetical protein